MLSFIITLNCDTYKSNDFFGSDPGFFCVKIIDPNYLRCKARSVDWQLMRIKWQSDDCLMNEVTEVDIIASLLLSALNSIELTSNDFITHTPYTFAVCHHDHTTISNILKEPQRLTPFSFQLILIILNYDCMLFLFISLFFYHLKNFWLNLILSWFCTIWLDFRIKPKLQYVKFQDSST